MWKTKVDVYPSDKPVQKITDIGAKNLAAAIIAKAAVDYYDVCDHPLNERRIDYGKSIPLNLTTSRDALEWFIDSDWFNTLTNISPEYFRETIKDRKRKKLGMNLENKYYGVRSKNS